MVWRAMMPLFGSKRVDWQRGRCDNLGWRQRGLRRGSLQRDGCDDVQRQVSLGQAIAWVERTVLLLIYCSVSLSV